MLDVGCNGAAFDVKYESRDEELFSRCCQEGGWRSRYALHNSPPDARLLKQGENAISYPSVDVLIEENDSSRDYQARQASSVLTKGFQSELNKLGALWTRLTMTMTSPTRTSWRP